MFQFRRFPTYAYLIQRRLTEYCSAGFPHSEICGSKLMCSSPQLIAACHVLLRLLMPRHSPCALFSLTSSARTAYHSLPPVGESSLTSSRLLFLADPLRWAPLGEVWFFSRIMQASVRLHCSLCYPLKVHKLNFVPLLLLARNHFASLFSFQGAVPAFLKTRSKCSPYWANTSIHSQKSSGGPKWTRTTDLTIISRAL